jgi:hypothetical protein
MIDFIGEYKNLISSEYCEAIIQWIETCDLVPGTTGNITGTGEINLKYKESFDVGLWFTKPNAINELVSEALMNAVTQYKKEHQELERLSKWRVDYGYNIQKYLPGKGYYVTHCECGSYKLSERMLVWMIYFNTIDNGGGTEFPILKKTIKAEAGKCVIWPAGWTHMHNGVVAPDDTKYIATGWFVFEEEV